MLFIIVAHVVVVIHVVFFSFFRMRLQFFPLRLRTYRPFHDESVSVVVIIIVVNIVVVVERMRNGNVLKIVVVLLQCFYMLFLIMY